jgi:hypothetical protein
LKIEAERKIREARELAECSFAPKRGNKSASDSATEPLVTTSKLKAKSAPPPPPVQGSSRSKKIPIPVRKESSHSVPDYVKDDHNGYGYGDGDDDIGMEYDENYINDKMKQFINDYNVSNDASSDSNITYSNQSISMNGPYTQPPNPYADTTFEEDDTNANLDVSMGSYFSSAMLGSQMSTSIYGSNTSVNYEDPYINEHTSTIPQNSTAKNSFISKNTHSTSLMYGNTNSTSSRSKPESYAEDIL